MQPAIKTGVKIDGFGVIAVSCFCAAQL